MIFSKQAATTPRRVGRSNLAPMANTLLGLALVTGCGPSSEEALPEVERAPAPTESSGPTTRTEFQIPAEGFVVDVAHGQTLFTRHCAVCHGAEALGTDQGPPLIHRIYEPSHHSDLAFYRAIALGTHQHHWEFGNMPPVSGVGGEEAAHIIGWIRREQRAAGIE
jgi:mono/diheme cytochrome c family protein